MTRDEALKAVTDPEAGFTDPESDKRHLAEVGAGSLLVLLAAGLTKDEALNFLGGIVGAVRDCYGD